MTREAYSHEVISHGWWPGNKDMEAAFYSYTTPEPAGLARCCRSGKDSSRANFLQLGDERVFPAVRRRPQLRFT